MHFHHHCDGSEERNRYLKLALLSLVTFIVEFAAGTIAKSTTLRADALHTLFDTLESLLNAGIAERSRILARAETTRRVGFVVGACLLLTSTAWMAWEACQSLTQTMYHELPVWSVWIACFALAMNLVMWRVHEGAAIYHRNVTHWTQRLHILTDISGSVIAIMGTILVSTGYWPKADAIGTFLIVSVVWGRISYAAYELFVTRREATGLWTHHH